MRAFVMLAVALTPAIGYSQAPVIHEAVNAASFTQLLSPGSLVSIFGNGLSASTETASTVPLPDSIGGVTVTFNGIRAPLHHISPIQINAQVPWNVLSGLTDIVVSLNGSASAAFRAQVGPVSPAIFTIPSGSRQAVAFDPGCGCLAASYGSLPGLPTEPAWVGYPLTIFATGLGPVAPGISDAAASGDQIRTTIATPIVLVNGSPASVTFSGLSPQFVGVYQINIIVPEAGWGESGGGGQMPIQIELGGIRTSDQVTIQVKGKWDY